MMYFVCMLIYLFQCSSGGVILASEDGKIVLENGKFVGQLPSEEREHIAPKRVIFQPHLVKYIHRDHD